jgi:hypothetical protein
MMLLLLCFLGVDLQGVDNLRTGGIYRQHAGPTSKRLVVVSMPGSPGPRSPLRTALQVSADTARYIRLNITIARNQLRA